MKKILNTLALLLCIFIVSCSNDDNEESSAVKVISSDVNFDAAGGNGTIKVAAASGTFSAASNKDWCTVSVEGDAVNVSVTENDEMIGRTAAVTITSGEGSTMVPVSQGGSIVLYNKSELGHAFSYAGGTATVAFKTNSNYQVDIQPADAASWLKYNVDKEAGTLTFTVDASTAKVPRGAAVSITAGKKTIVYNIGEYEMQDVAGTWNVSFVDAKGNTLAGDIEVVQDEEEPSIFYLAGISDFADLPVIFSDGAIRAMAGLNLGKYSSYNVYTVAYSVGGYQTWELGVQYVAYPSSIDGKFALVFGDNGSMSGDVIYGLGYEAFSGSPSSSTDVGYLERFFDIVLRKL